MLLGVLYSTVILARGMDLLSRLPTPTPKGAAVLPYVVSNAASGRSETETQA
jgi:hypothetical protein